MKTALAWLALSGIGVLTLFAACGSGVCDSTTCKDGCCHDRICYLRQTYDTCGTGGVECAACALNETCSEGSCKLATNKVCSSVNCPDGCCDARLDCHRATDSYSCGLQGAACETDPAKCSTCNPQNCPNGCCQYGRCITEGTLCGFNGGSCFYCNGGIEHRRCDHAIGQCVQCPGTTSGLCQSNQDCCPGDHCTSGTCYPCSFSTCNVDTDCCAGTRCVNGTCSS